MATGCGLGFQSSNQSSPELGAAIHSLILTDAGLATEARILPPFGVGSVTPQLPVPFGKRPIEKSVGCNPKATELSWPPPLAGLSKRKRFPPEALMLKPVLVGPMGMEALHSSRLNPRPAMVLPGANTY